MKLVISIALVLLLNACSMEEKKSSTENVDGTKKEVSEKKIEKEVSSKVEEVETAKTAKVQRSGQDIYVTCSACHGVDGSRKALGKSLSIKGWNTEKTMNALNGYKNGTYGGEMKGIMKAQVSELSDEDIRLVSKYISEL